MWVFALTQSSKAFPRSRYEFQQIRDMFANPIRP